MKKGIVFLIIICVLCVGEWIRELCTFRVTHYQIHSPKLNALKKERKIVFLSDLHNKCYGKENSKLLEAIRKENPECILIAGDMIVGRVGDSVESTKKFIEKLTEIAPVYYENGNHEYRMKIDTEKYGNVYETYRKELKECGVHFLENSKVTLQWDGILTTIYGLEIPEKCYTRWKKVPFTQDEMKHLLGEADPEEYRILLAHNPVYTATYLEWGADLSLSGHLHGGIVRLPFLGGVITPQMKLFPKYSGELTQEGDAAVVVGKGLGTHTINVRFLNPAEVVVLHMNSEV